MRIRGLFLHLMVLLALSACAGGSGRQGTEIVVAGSAPTTQLVGGSTFNFTMTVTNAGPYDASNIKLVDNVGNQLKLNGITCAAAKGAICPTAPNVEMTIPALTNGGVLTFSVNVTLDSGANGTVQNSLVADFAYEIDPTQESAVATATAFTPVTNVVVGGTGPAAPVVGGSTAVFVMTVTNNGPEATGMFNVYDNVGAGLTFLSATCTAAGGALCPMPVGVLTAVPTLPSGGVLTFTVTTQVGQNANGVLNNELVVNVSTNPVSSNNSFTAYVTVVTADLQVTGTAPAGPLTAGSAAAFVMVVANNGPGTAQNLSITNTLSANLTASGPITCAASAGSMCPTATASPLAVPTLPEGGVLTFTVPFTVNQGANGALTDTLSVTSTTDPQGTRTTTVGVGSGSSNLVVAESVASPVYGGANAVFTATVTNTGPSAANNVTVTYVLSGPAGNVATVGCTPTPNVACPTVLGPSMTLPSLGVGRSLTFTFTVAVPESADGQAPIVNTVAASAPGNADLTGNTATAMIVAENSHNGLYQLYAANGIEYALNIDFDTGSYSIIGNGQTINSVFTADANGDGGYTVSGNTKLRVNTNLIVGGADFGNGVIPYVAAKKFGSTIQQLASTPGPEYNLMYLNIPPGGAAVTSAGTAHVSGNTLSICHSLTAVSIPQNCPSGSLQNYALSINGNIYSGTNTATGDPLPFTFQLAQVGATAALISAETATDGSQQLFIGLPDAAALAGGTTQGASNTGDWVTIMLTATATGAEYSVTGLSSAPDSAPLSRINPSAGPFSLLDGNRVSDGALIYVMEAVPFTIEFGGNGSAASGELQVTIP